MGTTHVIKDKTFTLEGFQSPFKAGKFGTCGIKVIVDQDTVDTLEAERDDMITSKIQKQPDPKRWVAARNTKWSDVDDGKYVINFTWKPDQAPVFVDSEGTVITEEIPLYSGSAVKIKFDHYPYPDNTRKEVNTTCKLLKVQVISCSGGAGVDSGGLDFDKTEGFKLGTPRVSMNPPDEDTNDDF
jgi:hypothetical protein